MYVNYAIVLQLLSSFSTNNFSLNWFKCYLLYRKQKLKINYSTGQESDFENHVPQDGVLLGSFFIYILHTHGL